MKVLMLSTDKKILEKGSEVQERMIGYAKSWDELHIIVYMSSKEKAESSKVGNNVYIYPTNSWFKPFYFFDAYKIGKKIILDSRFQILDSVITCQDPFETGLAGLLIKKRFNLPLEIQAHTDFLSPYFKKESFKNLIRVILAKFLIKKADHLRVVSNRIKNSLIKLGCPASKIEVRPIAVDLDKIKNSPIKTDLHKKYPSHNFIILMASRLTKEKNISLAIKAMAGVVNQFPKTLLLIVGDGPEKNKLRLLVSYYQLRGNVVFESWTDDLISYYKTADLYLLTSNYEGYSRTAVGAQAAGLPVLMTDVGVAIGEVFPVGDLKTLVAKLSDLIPKLKK